jgi:hypothetical protein
MPALEDLLRDELRRVTDAVRPEALRPLRMPPPGPRRRPGLLLPATAAAAVVVVVAIAVVAALLVGPPVRPQPYVAPAPAPAAMPRYYVTVAKTSAGLEAVVRDSARGSVTGTALLPQTQAAAGQSVAAAADGHTFVIAVGLTDTSTIPGTVAMRYFRLPVSAGGRPGRPTVLPPGLGRAEPLTGMAVSPDGTMLALSLKHLGFTTNVSPTGDIEVFNLSSSQTRTWTGRGQPGYWPGTPQWENGDRTLTFTWWHTTSQTAGSAVIAGVRQLDTSVPGSNLLASRLIPFTAIYSGASFQSAIITSGGREIVASACHDTALPGHSHGRVTAWILELSAADGHLVRVLRIQTASYRTVGEQDILDGGCTVLSADPSGDHLLVQDFGFGRLDHGVFTALPGATPDMTNLAAGW